jgi:ATP-binding cassette subfamily B (MDR/TAP) protein 1
MEKAPVDINASNVIKDEDSQKPPPQDDDPEPDYSSKATTKTTFSDYLRIFTYSTLGDRIFLVCSIFMDESPNPRIFGVVFSLQTSLKTKGLV